jgi:hypothetical protein
MAEEQALDRVHRLGQTREVIVIRYIVRDSIEEVSYRTIPEIPEKSCSNRFSISRKLSVQN